jgi:hypothetical protein
MLRHESVFAIGLGLGHVGWWPQACMNSNATRDGKSAGAASRHVLSKRANVRARQSSVLPILAK